VQTARDASTSEVTQGEGMEGSFKAMMDSICAQDKYTVVNFLI
jgi:hypothetical protein